MCLTADRKKPVERLKIQQKAEIVSSMMFLRRWIGIESKTLMKQFGLYRRKKHLLQCSKTEGRKNRNK